MKFLDGFANIVENKIAPPLVKVSDNIFLLSIRDGAMAAMPFFVVGSFILMIVFFSLAVI